MRFLFFDLSSQRECLLLYFIIQLGDPALIIMPDRHCLFLQSVLFFVLHFFPIVFYNFQSFGTQVSFVHLYNVLRFLCIFVQYNIVF